jgi:hypothetical protein
MLGWLGTPLGRILQGILGIALLWIGMMQVTALGLLTMMTGLITAVVAAVPPAFLLPAPVVRGRSRPPSQR